MNKLSAHGITLSLLISPSFAGEQNKSAPHTLAQERATARFIESIERKIIRPLPPYFLQVREDCAALTIATRSEIHRQESGAMPLHCVRI